MVRRKKYGLSFSWKRATGIPLIVLLFASVSIAQTGKQRRRSPKPPDVESPSLKDTLDFLREKISTAAFYERVFETEDHLEAHHVTYKVESIGFDGCSISYKTLSNSWWKTDPRITEQPFTTKANLADIDPAAIRVDKEGSETNTVFAVLADTRDKVKTVQQHRELKKETTRMKADEATYQISFSFTDEDIANRVSRALKHAVELCAAKKEAF